MEQNDENVKALEVTGIPDRSQKGIGPLTESSTGQQRGSADAISVSACRNRILPSSAGALHSSVPVSDDTTGFSAPCKANRGSEMRITDQES
jgi:hypothetical protein